MEHIVTGTAVKRVQDYASYLNLPLDGVLVEQNVALLLKHKKELLDVLLADHDNGDVFSVLHNPYAPKILAICELLGIEGNERIGLFRSFSFNNLMEHDINFNVLQFFIEKV